MKRLSLFLLIFCLPLMVFSADNRLTKINAVKKRADYLYGEATMPTQQEAASLAFEMLQKEVLSWAEQTGQKHHFTSIADINRLADTIMVRRANMYRVFAYVEKSVLTQQQPQAAHNNAVPTDSTASDTVKAEQPKDMLVTDSVKQVIMQRFFGRKQNDALLRLNEAKNFFELKDIMQPLKEEGKIIDFGKYATAEDPEQCYLIIYDPAGNICALLGKGKDVRENLRTGQADSIRNYRGCGAIWFKLNE